MQRPSISPTPAGGTLSGPAPFEGKVALVTGSGRGIGREIALTLAGGGADLVVNFFRNRAPAEDTAAAVEGLGRRALVARANIGDPDQLEGLFATTDAAFSGLDILVCNAASGYNRPVIEQRVKGWDWTMNINARSALFAAQHALPLMQRRGGGVIVNISSIGAQRTLPDYAVVGASKAALEAVTRYLAVELAPYNIVVNAVSSSVIATEALKHFEFTRDGTLLKDIAAHTPAGRNVEPADIAGVVAFLCTPAAAMIRGQVILVDGGFTLTAVRSAGG
jgi:enoyl-[acyl-carrier protein] reductase III